MSFSISTEENFVKVSNRAKKHVRLIFWGLISCSILFIAWVFTTDMERGVILYPLAILGFSVWKVAFYRITIFDTASKTLSLEKQIFFKQKLTTIPFVDVRKILFKPSRSGYRSTAQGSLDISGPSVGVNGIILTNGSGDHKFYFERSHNAKKANKFAKKLAGMGFEVEGRANRYGAEMN